MKTIFILLFALLTACEESAAPKGRVIALSAPENEDDARRAGCFSSGTRAGAGFGELIRAIGGLGQYFELRDGHIRSVMITEAYLYDGPASNFSLRLLPGVDLGYGKVGVDESAGETASELPDATIADDYWVDLYADRFQLPAMPIFDDYPLDLVLESLTFTGKIYVDEVGLTVEAVLSGYLTRDRLRAALDDFIAGCAQNEAALTCARAAELLGSAPTTELLEQKLLELTAGYDAAYEPGRPALCNNTDCNALSVCLTLEAQPIQLQ